MIHRTTTILLGRDVLLLGQQRTTTKSSAKSLWMSPSGPGVLVGALLWQEGANQRLELKGSGLRGEAG